MCTTHRLLLFLGVFCLDGVVRFLWETGLVLFETYSEFSQYVSNESKRRLGGCG